MCSNLMCSLEYMRSSRLKRINQSCLESYVSVDALNLGLESIVPTVTVHTQTSTKQYILFCDDPLWLSREFAHSQGEGLIPAEAFLFLSQTLFCPSVCVCVLLWLVKRSMVSRFRDSTGPFGSQCSLVLDNHSVVLMTHLNSSICVS